MTPREIVAELNKYIVGQDAAKKAVAIAIRNRWRRQQLPVELRENVTPKNIIMIGPTGVGKTEIARRLAQLISAPFIKVEATKFTEVGYHGRDVDSIIRDLTERAIGMERDEAGAKVRERAERAAEDRVIDQLLPQFDTNDGRIEAPWSQLATPDEILQQHELRALVRAKIAELPESYRIVLLLRDIEELSTEDVARLLGVSAPAVKVRLHRARSALKKLIEPILRREV